MAGGQLIGSAIPHDENASYDQFGASHTWTKAGEFADAGGAAGPIGMGIGAIIGTIYGWATADEEYEQQQRLKRKRERLTMENKNNMDISALVGKATTGGMSAGYKALGGEMIPKEMLKGNRKPVVVKGGSLTTIAKGVQKVQSDSPEEDTVALSNGTNVDKKELILDGKRVLSSKLGFAQVAEELLKNPKIKALHDNYKNAEIELTKMAEIASTKANDPHVNNTNARNAEKAANAFKRFKNPLDEVYAMQESYKKVSGFTDDDADDFAEGGAFNPQYLSMFADNIANAIITEQSPDVPAPLLSHAVPLNTRVEVGDQIGSINSGLKNYERAVTSNTSSSSDALSRIMLGTATGIDAKNKVYANKANIEMQLQNQNRLNAQTVGNANIAKINDFNTAVATRESNKLAAHSANVADAGQDFNQIFADTNKAKVDAEQEAYDREYQEKQLKIWETLYNTHGTAERFNDKLNTNGGKAVAPVNGGTNGGKAVAPITPATTTNTPSSNLTGYTTHDDTPLTKEEETVIKNYTSAENGVKDIPKDVIRKAKKLSMTSNVSFEQALQKFLIDIK